MKEFNMNERLDVLYTMSHLSHYFKLRQVVKPDDIITWQVANACAESGFSANEEMLVKNKSKASLVALRMVFYGAMNDGSVLLMLMQLNRKSLSKSGGT